MRVIKRSTLSGYWRRYPTAEQPLRQWLGLTLAARWQTLVDVRRAFPHADAVLVGSGNTVTVFNVGGNNYRLIVAIKYRWGVVYVRDFLTHAEYSADRWKRRH